MWITGDKMKYQNKNKRPKTFDEKLRDFLKQSDANQREIMRRNHKYVGKKRR